MRLLTQIRLHVVFRHNDFAWMQFFSKYWGLIFCFCVWIWRKWILRGINGNVAHILYQETSLWGLSNFIHHNFADKNVKRRHEVDVETLEQAAGLSQNTLSILKCYLLYIAMNIHLKWFNTHFILKSRSPGQISGFSKFCIWFKNCEFNIWFRAWSQGLWHNRNTEDEDH